MTFYDPLVEIRPSPVVALNRVIALAELAGPRAGLDALAAIDDQGVLKSYHAPSGGSSRGSSGPADQHRRREGGPKAPLHRGMAGVSLWEMAMLIARGAFQPRGTPEAWLTEAVQRTGIVVREITPTVAALAAHFPADFPADPADRLIAATARADGLPLVTRDRHLRRSRLIETVW